MTSFSLFFGVQFSWKELKNLAIFFIFDLILPQVEKRISYQFIYKKEKKMSKGTGARKEEKKKKSTKTIKEKRADKKAKKKAWVTALKASVVILNYSWNPVCIKKGLWIIQVKYEFPFPKSGMRIEGVVSGQ